MTDTIQTLTAAVKSADGVKSLARALNDLENFIAAAQESGDLSAHTRLDDFIDTTALPIFDGQEPNSTMGVFSWDATHLLYGDGYAPQKWTAAAR